MILPKHNKIFEGIFSIYLALILKRGFRRIRISSEFTPPKNKSLLIIANHISWWDGFWVFWLNRKLWKRKFYVMMLEEQLKRHRFLRKLGAFSVNPGKKSVVRSFRYASEILAESNNLLLFYPEGNIGTQYRFPKKFQSGGIDFLLSSSHNSEVIFVANLVDYYSNKKPVLSIYIGRPEISLLDKNEVEKAYNQFYGACIKKEDFEIC